MAKHRVILFGSLMAVILAGLVMLVVFGEIFQCQRTTVTVRPDPPAAGAYLKPIPGANLELNAAGEKLELPPGTPLEILEAGESTARVRLLSDGTEGTLRWYDDGREWLEPVDSEIAALYDHDSYTVLEALRLSESLGLAWHSDAFAYACASGAEPDGGRHREWEIAYYSPATRRALKIVVTAGVRTMVLETDVPVGDPDAHTTWPLGAPRNPLAATAVDSPAALETALANDDRPQRELDRWRLDRIYLVHQDDPENTGEAYRDRPTYHVLLRLAAPMNDAEDREYTDLVVDGASGDFLARLGG